MTQNSILMIQTIEKMEDLQKSIKNVEEKLKESTKLVMLLLETPCGLPPNFAGTLGDALNLKIELSNNNVKEESVIENHYNLPNEMMVPDLVVTKVEWESLIEEQKQNLEINPVDENIEWESLIEEQKPNLEIAPVDENVVSIEKNLVVLERREDWPDHIEPKKRVLGKVEEGTSVLEVDLPPVKKKKKKNNGYKARKGYCEDCKKHYAVIKEHRRTVHDKITKSWTCPLCSIKIEYIHFTTCFNHKQECEARITGIVDKYSCPGCEEKFPTVKLWEGHKKTCLTKQGLIPKFVQPKTCICTYEGCDYKSHRKQMLKNHIHKVHLNIPIEKNQYCDFCGLSFSHKKSLHIHVIKHHTSRKDFACNICDSKFSTRNDFRQHMEIHSEVKKYVCPFCGKGFKQGSVLYRHKLSCKSNPEK